MPWTDSGLQVLVAWVRYFGSEARKPRSWVMGLKASESVQGT